MSGGSGGGLRVSAKCRGSQHLAGCIVVPSDEDCLTFSAIFASQETYKLRASNVKERQVLKFGINVSLVKHWSFEFNIRSWARKVKSIVSRHFEQIFLFF